jgi:S1-C subfamily serine protease
MATTDLSDRLADAVDAIAPSIVRVRARRGLAASGIAISANQILTADHVVDPQAEGHITIGLPDGSEVTATLAGRDSTTDVALLTLAEPKLTPARTAAGEARVGSLGLVVARPATNGVQASLALVSGHGGPARTRRGGILERYLLVDTVMYPGFSGGAVVNSSGEVIALATSGLSVGGPDVAIPWSVASKLAETLAKHGKVARGYLGVGSQPISLAPAARELLGGQERGLLIVSVSEGGPAAAGGLVQGDILVGLDGASIANADDLQSALSPDKVGKASAVKVVRGGELKELTVIVGSRA